MLQGILSGAAWFALFLVVHVVWFHIKHIKDCFALIMRIYLICLAGHAATIVFLSRGTYSMGQTLVSMSYGFLLAGCLFILYMPFYYNLVNSLSIQTLILLTKAPGRTLPRAELQETFAGESIVAGRLDTMVTNGYLTLSNRRYCLTPQGRTVARFFGAIKDFWKMGTGG